jgi:glycosyl hydrolase family 123
MQRSRSPVHSFPATGLFPPAFWFLTAALILSGLPLTAQKHSMPARGASDSIRVHGDTLELPGLVVQLTPQGFPQQLQWVGTTGAAGSLPDTTDLLAENIHFHFTRLSDGKDIRLNPEGWHVTMQRPDTLKWQATSSSDVLRLETEGAMNSGGLLSFDVKVTALQDLNLKDITFHIPFAKEVTKYMNGLGATGIRPDSILAWNWRASRNHRAKTWIGDGHAGLLFQFSSSQGDQGIGGITVGIKGKSMLLNEFSGPSSLPKTTALIYHFTLLVTHKQPDSRTFIE